VRLIIAVLVRKIVTVRPAIDGAARLAIFVHIVIIACKMHDVVPDGGVRR
jgi:hypothetical protein